MRKLEDRIVAHHVGGRGFGVALNCPPGLAKDLVHVLYEADEVCAREMIAQNKDENFHVLPYCLGAKDGPGKIFITRNPYASSNFEPSAEYAKYYCELHLDGEVEGVPLQNAVYDVVYGHDYGVAEVRDVTIRALDGIVDAAEEAQGLVPDFLSLDTQGSELNILKGGERTFHAHSLALATEIEFHPMYQRQALFSDIFDFALRHGFHFVGFTYQQEISPHRLPLGARAKGVLAFGDALFFRNIDSVREVAKSQDELYLMLLKLAFIALNFGYLEFAMQALDAAEQAKPDPELRGRVRARDCYRLLYELRDAVKALPPHFPHFERSKMIAERKAILDRAQAKPAVVPVATPAPAPAPVAPVPAPSRNIGGAIQRTELPEFPVAAPTGPRIRHLIFTNPPLAIAKIWRHFFPANRHVPPPPQPVAAPINPPPPATPDPAPAAPSAPPASAHTTAVEAVLEKYGYVWWADVVRRRRKSAEHCIPGRMY